MKNHITLFCLFLFVQFLGQAQNPIMIKDIGQIPEKWISSTPHSFTEVDGKIFFLADDGSDAGLEMWRTDGTAAGTELISDLNDRTDSQWCNCSSNSFTAAVNLDNEGYWLTRSGYADGIKLWKAGATGNAQKIEDLPYGVMQDLVVFQNKIFIPINGELWVSNGIPNEATLIFDVDRDRLTEFKIIGDRLYFARRIANIQNRLLDEVEIWSTDGTAAGTVLYKKVVGDAPTECGRYEVKILNFDGRVAYTLQPGSNSVCDNVSWIFVEGFDPIMEEYPLGIDLVLSSPVFRDNKIYYLSYEDLTSGREHYLKVFENGTSRVIKSFTTSLKDLKLLPSGEIIFQSLRGFWRTDGTANGTVMFHDEITFSELFAYQDGYVFTDIENDKIEFWKTDGTDAGTEKIADFPYIFEQFDPYNVLDQEIIVGNYFYFGENDGQHGAELWRLDLESPGTFIPTPPSSPGLSIEEIQTAATVILDEPTDVVFDIVNSGDASLVGDVSVGIYISIDSDFTTDDILVGEVVVSALAVNQVKKITTQFTLPSNLEHLKTYKLLVYADHNQLVAERDETNNVDFAFIDAFDANAPKVDLQPIVRNVPYSGKPGAVLFADVRARNNGTEDSPSSSTGLYFSTDRTLSPDDIFLGENITGNVDAGATSDQRSIRFTVPAVPNGDYFLISVVDYQDGIAEFDETNNVAVTSFKTPPPVDLETEFAFVQLLGSALVPYIRYSIFNFGAEPAPYFKIGVYLSTDDQVSTDDQFLGEGFSFNPIMPGDFFDGSIQLIIPASVPSGDYHILVFADYEEQIAESNESNNVFSIPFTVTAVKKVDLELSFDDLADPDPKRWSYFSPTLTVENNGSDLAENIAIQVPRPSDVIYSGGNEYVASQGGIKVYSSEIWRVGDLAPGESATLQLNYFRMDSDPFPVYAQVQSVDQIDDDSTPNNGNCCVANEDDEAVLQVEVAPPTFVRRNGSNPTATALFDIQVSPNPFKNQFVAEVISEENATVELSIFDVTGKVIWRKPLELQKGYNSISIDGSDLPSGVLMMTASPATPYWKPIRLVKMD